MKIIYLIGVGIILKLIHSVYKNLPKNKKEIHSKSNYEIELIEIESLIEVPMVIPKETPIEKPNVLGKNKWLYPTDEFGKMESGRQL